LISTRDVVSTVGTGTVAAAGFLVSPGGTSTALVAAGLAAVLVGLDAACARACADAPVARTATNSSANEIERFIGYFTDVSGTYGFVRAT
jgi:hypothetical protein